VRRRQALGRSAKAVALVAARCALHVLDRGAQAGAQAVARGAARSAPHILDRGAQAGAQTVSCGDATPPQQDKNTQQVSRRT
jgi:hypothetical protein